MSPILPTRRHFLIETFYAFFGETPLGFVGATLQWLAMAIALTYPTVLVSLPAAWLLALLLFGIFALIAGLPLALHGKSLGPLIAIPALVGIGLLLLLNGLLYPLRFLLPPEPLETPDRTSQRSTSRSEQD